MNTSGKIRRNNKKNIHFPFFVLSSVGWRALAHRQTDFYFEFYFRLVFVHFTKKCMIAFLFERTQMRAQRDFKWLFASVAFGFGLCSRADRITQPRMEEQIGAT